MQVKFFNTSSDNSDVKKVLSTITTKECKIYGDCSIQSPSFLVNMADNLINANYIYVEKFNRYYYITSLTILDGTMARVETRVDVLMSFWNDFKNSPCIAKRSASSYTNAVDDPYILKKPSCHYDFRRMAKSFTPTDGEGHYLLTIGGAN